MKTKHVCAYMSCIVDVRHLVMSIFGGGRLRNALHSTRLSQMY